MSAHTPGPWMAREGELDDDPYFDVVAKSNSISGEKVVFQTIIGDKRYPEYTAAERANATLGAAAPELLEALKAWEHWYSEDSSQFNRDAARDMGLKAIAKAEGRS